MRIAGGHANRPFIKQHPCFLHPDRNYRDNLLQLCLPNGISNLISSFFDGLSLCVSMDKQDVAWIVLESGADAFGKRSRSCPQMRQVSPNSCERARTDLLRKKPIKNWNKCTITAAVG
jgi:hypothetical protein